MIPLRDNIPSRTKPIASLTILVINVAIYLLLELPLSGEDFQALVLRWGLTPAEVVQGHPVVALVGGAKFGYETLSLFDRFVPFFTSMFLHASFLHLAGNMLFLYIFGDNVEDVFGHAGFAVFYLVSGIAAALFQIIIGRSSPVPMVGASGAIAGVLGAYLFFYPNARVLTLFFFYIVTTVELPAAVYLGIWILYQFLYGAVALVSPEGGGVAYWAHIGGFIAGLTMAFGISRIRPHRKKRPDALEIYMVRRRPPAPWDAGGGRPNGW